jgi:hypothetical protein
MFGAASAYPSAQSSYQANDGKRHLHDRCTLVTWAEFRHSEFRPALDPRRMFDEVNVDGCASKQASGEDRSQFPPHSASQ